MNPVKHYTCHLLITPLKKNLATIGFGVTANSLILKYLYIKNPPTIRKHNWIFSLVINALILIEERIGGLNQRAADSSMQSLIEQTYITEQLRLRKAEYSIEDNLSVYILTYNAAGKKPKAGVDIIENFFTGKSSINEEIKEDWPGLYAFCIQEVRPLNTRSVIAKGDNAQVWEAFLLKSINSYSMKKGVEYVKVVSKDMFSIFTLVLIRKDKESIYNKVTSVVTEVPVGIFGIVVRLVIIV